MKRRKAAQLNRKCYRVRCLVLLQSQRPGVDVGCDKEE